MTGATVLPSEHTLVMCLNGLQMGKRSDHTVDGWSQPWQLLVCRYPSTGGLLAGHLPSYDELVRQCITLANTVPYSSGSRLFLIAMLASSDMARQCIALINAAA